ncbi:heart- and neural crest derivatives-expressed protein 1-like [Corythoichthys intestinalis]|uniref:heart- and neural crest derivatives-expressed protein 1-like n=1 Tax=Corythoichthys intestinalis TaxID=161448 RepID=UPI0025A54EAF|nr:heart- and neural crest derivatives-expressed protein 1-like [Corythoichthys intestinalis]XP_057677714.1 heart- and neural crest derivatives-expressed protein 1-like [Corythoichthys intestinalis]
MNLIGGYQHHHHHHHHHLMHEPFPFVQRCHQDAPYFQSWVLNHGEVPPDFQIQTPYPAGTDLTPAASVAAASQHDHGRLEGLQSGMTKRRTAGPKKERRRTESINTAFAELRECIPNVPADTKLSKIKTLRLATSYIAYLMDVLAKDAGDTEGFKAEIKKFENRDLKRKRDMNEGPPQDSFGTEKKVKGRTGWPQQVWALELNQ